jgi:hypothetical protein
VLPVLQEAAAPAPSENPPVTPSREAILGIFFLISLLPHTGQVTSEMASELRKCSSKDWLQLLQLNSNNGITGSCFSRYVILNSQSWCSWPGSEESQPLTSQTIGCTFP